MKDIAEFRITGRIGKSSIKDKVAFLDIASNYRRKVNDEWEDDTHWNRVTLFGKNIDRAAELAVGDKVRVKGRVRQSRYERNGEVVYGTDVIAERVGALPKGGTSAGGHDDD